MEGLHIIANFYGCHFDLYQNELLLEKCKKFCLDAGLHIVGVTSHAFEPQGLTFAILLAESHLSIHTWPEDGNVAFDIYTCNYQQNNSEKTRYVYENLRALLRANNEQASFISRQTLPD